MSPLSPYADRWLTERESGALLGLSVETLRKWRAKRIGPPFSASAGKLSATGQASWWPGSFPAGGACVDGHRGLRVRDAPSPAAREVTLGGKTVDPRRVHAIAEAFTRARKLYPSFDAMQDCHGGDRQGVVARLVEDQLR